MTRCERRRLRQLSTIFWSALGALGALAVLVLLTCGSGPGPEAPDTTPSPVYLNALTSPVQEPEAAPEAKNWTRYDVPLADELQQYIEGVCAEYDMDAAVVMALIDVESGCDPDLIGDEGRAYGLMQVRGDVHYERCARLGAVNLLDPRQNVRAGIDFLAWLRDCGHGMEWALSWYNGHGGEPCAYADIVLAEAETLRASAEEVRT